MRRLDFDRERRRKKLADNAFDTTIDTLPATSRQRAEVFKLYPNLSPGEIRELSEREAGKLIEGAKSWVKHE